METFTQDKVDEAIKMVTSMATEIIGKGETHAPMIFLFDGDELRIGLLQGVPPAHAHRLLVMSSQTFDAAMFVTEAWTATGKDAETVKRPSELPPDQRGEALILHLLSGSDEYMCMCPIDRGAKSLTVGKVEKIEAGRTSSGMELHGGMVVNAATQH